MAKNIINEMLSASRRKARKSALDKALKNNNETFIKIANMHTPCFNSEEFKRTNIPAYTETINNVHKAIYNYIDIEIQSVSEVYNEFSNVCNDNMTCTSKDALVTDYLIKLGIIEGIMSNHYTREMIESDCEGLFYRNYADWARDNKAETDLPKFVKNTALSANELAKEFMNLYKALETKNIDKERTKRHACFNRFEE